MNLRNLWMTLRSPMLAACGLWLVAFIAPRSSFLHAEEVFHGVAVVPGTLDAWVVTIESTGMYHTPDFGANWEVRTIMTTRDFFDVFFLDSRYGWTCGRGGDIWHTTNGGDSWYRQNLAGPKYTSRIQFLDPAHGWSSGGGAIMLHTRDSGTTWRGLYLRNPPYPADTVDFQGVSFVDSIHGWLVAGRYPEDDSFTAGQGYIVGLVADADTFIVTLQRKDTVYDFFDVEFVDGLNGWVVGGNDLSMNAVILRTSDGGTTWVQQPVPATVRLLRAVKFVSPTRGWACGRNGTIVHTSDGGATWQPQFSGVDTTLFDLDFADSLSGMAAGAGSTVLRTRDGGHTWERCYSAVAEPNPIRGRGVTGLAVLGNPARARVSLRLWGFPLQPEPPNPRTPEPRNPLLSSLCVTISEASGRVVHRSSFNGPVVIWDGRDESGVPVAPGVYVARAGSGSACATASFVLLR